jgi:bacteriorhodopsin
MVKIDNKESMMDMIDKSWVYIFFGFMPMLLIWIILTRITLTKNVKLLVFSIITIIAFLVYFSLNSKEQPNLYYVMQGFANSAIAFTGFYLAFNFNNKK